MGLFTSFDANYVWSCNTAWGLHKVKPSPLPPYLEANGLQYYVENTGTELVDILPVVQPPMEVCETAAVVLDGVGDSITYEKSIGNADNYKIILEARIGTILPGSGSEQLFYVKGSSTHVTYLTKVGRYVDGDGIERVYFVVRNGANNGYYTLKVRASVLVSYSNKFSTYVFELKNNHLSWTADGDPIKDMNIGNHRKGGSFLRFGCSNGPSAYASMQIKSIKVVADGVVVIDSKCEEGSGDLCLNAADGNNHGKLNSAAAGIPSMRNATADQVESHNAKFGCCKVPGIYYQEVPNDEFVYIPADENMIAQDPTMVPTIELSVDGVNFYTYDPMGTIENAVVDGHYWWTEFGTPGIPPELQELWIAKLDSRWQFIGQDTHLEFIDPTVLHNQYPPRGTFDVTVVHYAAPNETRQLTIRYANESIDDTGTIVKPNINCMPGKVHNGANYKIKEADSAAPKPSHSSLYDNSGVPLHLDLEGIQAIPNGTKDTAFRFTREGKDQACHLDAIFVMKEHTVENMTPIEFKSLVHWMCELGCGENIFVEDRYGEAILTKEGYYIVPRES